MTVKEMRKLLKGLPEETEIYFQMNSGCCGDTEEMEISDSEVIELMDSKDKYVSIWFSPLPGYKSCIQAGATVKKDKEHWEKYKK